MVADERPVSRSDSLTTRFVAAAVAVNVFVAAGVFVALDRFIPLADPVTGPLRLLMLAVCSAFIAGLVSSFVLARLVRRSIAVLSRAAADAAVEDGGSAPAFVPPVRGGAIDVLAGRLESTIDGLRAAQEDMRAARAYVVRIMESIPEALIVAERDDVGRFLICNLNKTAADLLGYAREQLVGQPLASILEHDTAAQGLLRRLGEQGAIRGRDARLRSASGSLREVSLSASRLPASSSAEGGTEMCVLVASDVAETKRNDRRKIATYRLSELAQEARTLDDFLRGVDAVLRTAIQVDAFHVALVDQSNGKITVPYAADPRTPQVSAHEVTKGLTGYVLEAEAAVIMSAEQIRMLVERGEVKAVEPVAQHWASAPLRLGGTTRGVIVVQNLDAARSFESADVALLVFAAEQVATSLRRRAAEEERQRLSAAVAHAVDAVLVFDPQGRVAYVNEAFERQTGFTKAEVLGRTLAELWLPDETQMPLDAVWAMVSAGQAWSGRTRCIRKSGDSVPVDSTLAAVWDGRGGVFEFVAVQHDVSTEIALEEQLRQAQKMEAIGLLAGGVAHDFNNLLSVIQGYGEMARAATDKPDVKSWMNEAIRAAERASVLVEQLLAFSRRQVIELRPLNLNEVMVDVDNMLRRVIGEDIQLEALPAPALDLVEADRGQIEQVLMNLVVNARDAMPRGGSILIRTLNLDLDAAQALALPGLEPGPHVALLVDDSGVGMTPEVQARIFEPFFTTKPQGQGTGLGLSTVYGIVKQLGGHVDVDSRIDEGTSFAIFLPSIGRGVVPAGDMDESQEPESGSETVLVVEDEQALRGFVARVLQEHGYRVIEADSGESGVKASRAHAGRIDLLLTDVVMPGMSGSALAATLTEERPGTPVLYMSGYPDKSIASYGVLDPEVDFLQKPFTTARLLKRVRRAVDRKRREAASQGASTTPAS